jgi:hypothetical protein
MSHKGAEMNSTDLTMVIVTWQDRLVLAVRVVEQTIS